jgi:DtxR family Mn-dependent transcriptional regulator
MTKRLADLGLVERAPYRGVALTEAGRMGALEVLRHHRLLELYLVNRLGLSWDEVHAEAELLEHALSEELEAKIDAELGFPTHDPHGDPIPDRELRVTGGGGSTLLDLVPGTRASVSRVPDGDPDLLRYLAELGLVPGSDVEVVSQAPFGGPITVRTERGDHAARASATVFTSRGRSAPSAASSFWPSSPEASSSSVMSAPPMSSPLTNTCGIVGQPEIEESSCRMRGSGRMSTVVTGAPAACRACSARWEFPHITICGVPFMKSATASCSITSEICSFRVFMSFLSS